ncbi:putative endo-beta-1,4-glucanase D [Madurella mycetomatis]|uniref:lytic cellulose monooxygenase (C4-dehydrogenating) n=1 Tax=Madurella mycetomatis TaxID=100816 RepID=A0A175WE63_9PEZI|nr:putative endo-beta-1,4-glucanase D [Madurella mycetomatis]
MRFFVLFTLGLASAFPSLSTAHTLFTTLFVNDVNQGDGTCVRMPKVSSTCTSPITDLDSPDMACGRDGQHAVGFTCLAAAGDKLTFEFRAWADASQPGVIDSSHLGSAAIYLKPVSNMTTSSAAGPNWFKIYAEGYDENMRKWATEKLIDNHGLLSINLPVGLPTGYYLVRTEILALQNVSQDGYVDPQFYVNCAQLFIEGSSTSDTLTIPTGMEASIPGHVTANHPGLTFNIYQDDPLTTPYEVVGPAAFFSTSASTIATTGKSYAKNYHQQDRQPAQAEGLIPPACLVKNANWCASLPPRYTDEATCWASSADCFRQAEKCYASAPPTGCRGCRVWERDMCGAIQQGCRSGLWQGPPADLAANVEKVEVDVPVPGGGKIPGAGNADVSWGREGGGGERGGVDLGSKKAVMAVVFGSPTATAISGCCGKSRKRRRRLA